MPAYYKHLFFIHPGQVYVMVPSASGLFANSESLINTSLDGDKATSLVQVLTVPAGSGSAFLGQQVRTNFIYIG
jgi:hypothetical protein